MGPVEAPKRVWNTVEYWTYLMACYPLAGTLPCEKWGINRQVCEMLPCPSFSLTCVKQ